MPDSAALRREGATLFAGSTARYLAWALLLLVPLLWQLGGTPLFDVDEGAFSAATREMLTSGDWGHTTLNGAPRFDKPIGIYWLQATSVHLFGLNEFALRLPSALSCWAMALALGYFAWQRWGERAGALAGVMTVTSLGYLAIGRAATADGLLNLLLVLATLDMWRYAESESRNALRRAYVWVALGLLVKGPVAIVVPGAAFFVWCATSRRWRLLVAALMDAWAWALLIAIAVPWYAYALHRHGMAFVEGFFLRHNVDRFTGTIGGHRGALGYYVLMLPVLGMPWSPLMAVVVARARRLWADPPARYLLGWAAFVLVFFSLSGTKLPHYVLYGYAPLVLLMARVLAEGGRRVAIIAGAGIAFWALCVAAAPKIVATVAPDVKEALYHALLTGAPAAAWWPPALAFAALVLLFAWRGAGAWRLPGAALVVALLLGGWSLPWFGETLQGPVRRAAAVAVTRPERTVQWDIHLPSFSVYARRVVPKGEPTPQDMVLARADRLPPGPPRERLFEERGIVLLAPLKP